MSAKARPNRPPTGSKTRRFAAHVGAARERQVAGGAAEDEVGLAGGEAGDRERRPLAAEQDVGQARIGSSASSSLRGIGEADAGRIDPAEPIGPGAAIVLDDRQLGMGEQLEEIGARPVQRDFEHEIGHRGDALDRAEDRLERVAARPAQRRAQPGRDLLGGDRAAVRPGRAADAEGVAQAVVGDDPALRQRRLDLAGAVEADQPLRERLDEEGRGRIERLQVRVGELGRPADRAHPDRPALLAAAAAEQQGPGQQGEAAISPDILIAATSHRPVSPRKTRPAFTPLSPLPDRGR